MDKHIHVHMVGRQAPQQSESYIIKIGWMSVITASRVHNYGRGREVGHVRSRSLPSAVPKIVSLLSDLHTTLQKCDDKEALKLTIPSDVMAGIQNWLRSPPDDYHSSKVRWIMIYWLNVLRRIGYISAIKRRYIWLSWRVNVYVAV